MLQSCCQTCRILARLLPAPSATQGICFFALRRTRALSVPVLLRCFSNGPRSRRQRGSGGRLQKLPRDVSWRIWETGQGSKDRQDSHTAGVSVHGSFLGNSQRVRPVFSVSGGTFWSLNSWRTALHRD